MSRYNVSTKQYLHDLILSKLTTSESKDVLARWTNMEVDAVNSRVTLHSRGMSTDGYIGQYGNDVTLSYPKIDLDVTIAYPLTFPWEYPTTWAMFASYMELRYDIVVEDGDFTLAGNSVTTPLRGTDRMDALPDSKTGHLTLMATSGSGRFKKGCSLKVVCTDKHAPVSLATLFGAAMPDGFNRLTDKH